MSNRPNPDPKSNGGLTPIHGPVPVPTQWSFRHAQVPTALGVTNMVVCDIATVVGTFTLFFTPDELDTLAGNAREAARVVRTGIVLPGPNGLQPPQMGGGS